MDESYFDFLMNIVRGYDGNHEVSINVCRILFDIPFRWDHEIPLDSDRAENGIALRLAYYKETGRHALLEGHECRVLEMLVALANDMDSVFSWIADKHPEMWFWQMLVNAGIADVDDEGYVVERINKIMDRNYTRSGKGGFFPLHYSPIDQRKNPIWSQAGAYMCEHM